MSTTAPLRFTKMSGAGNDFIVMTYDQARLIEGEPTAWTRRVCRRGLSVGADGVIVVRPEAPGRVVMTFLNPDGSGAFCGNGTRCAARFARAQGWCGDSVTLTTAIGDVPAELTADSVRITLPAPTDAGRVELDLLDGRVSGRWVTAGVPHFVVPVRDLAGTPVVEQGRLLRRHPHFGAAGVNVDFVAWRRDGGLGIRTFERGVEAETLSCGSGAVAAAFAARLDGAAERMLVVPWSDVPLHVTLAGPADKPVTAVLEGDARFVFEGTLYADALAGLASR